MSSTELIEKINKRTAKVGVIGLGYVGLPLVIEYCKEGFEVVGFDIDSSKVESLKAGKSYIRHIELDSIEQLTTKFLPTTDFSKLAEIDCILICVPTPLNKYREPNLSYVLETTQVIAKYLRSNQLVVLESTTYPGTTEEDMRSILEDTGLKAGVDFFLGYSPEREDPNNKNFSTGMIPKVVGGHTKDCLAVVDALYSQIVDKTVPVSSTKVAEAAKLLENIYRSVNIALVNELKVLFDRMEIDVWEVIKAAETKPFGFQAFYPGPGLGGHCIPIDPFYLSWKAREFDLNTRFIELAGEINTHMTHFVIQKTMDALNEHSKNIKNSKLLVLGVAYKKDIDDMRESPSLKLIELFKQKGAHVDYNDPYVDEIPKLRNYDLHLKSVELTEESLAQYDAVIIATDHSSYNPQWIYTHANLIVDTRNFMDVSLSDEKVVKA